MKRAFVAILTVAVVIASVAAITRATPDKTRGFGPIRLSRG